MEILSCTDVFLQRGPKKILQGVSLKIKQGETLALIGPNGAGKSSLLQVMSFLIKPTAGSICFKGNMIRNGRDLLVARRRMAVVFQQPLLLNNTVEYNLALGLKFRGVDDKDIRLKVAEWLEMLGIGHLRKQNAKTLSGGEAQRVNLARSLITEPELLFMDEPFTALDAPGKAVLIEDLSRIIRQKGLCAVFVTHDYNEVPFLASQVAVMGQGRIIQAGNAKEVFDRPAQKEIAALLGYENLLMGEIIKGENDGLIVSLGQNILKINGQGVVGQKILVCLRGREVHLAKGKTEFKGPGNIMQGRIERILPYGEQLKIDVNCGIKLTAALPQSKLFNTDMQIGDLVYLRIPPGAPHLIAENIDSGS